MDCTVRVVVEADAADTWDRLADIPAWPDWNPSCAEARLAGPLAPGTRMHLRLRHPRGRTFHTRPVVVEVERPGRLAWEARSLGLRARTTVQVEGDAAGAGVTLTSSTEGPMSFSYRWAMTPRTQAGIYEAMLNGLAESFR